MQKMKTASRRRGGMKQERKEINPPPYYHRPADLQLLKRIAGQGHHPLISAIARRVARSLEREQRRNGGAI